MSPRFAEKTTVSVASSRGEITGILTKYGCQHMAWATEPAGDTLQFILEGRSFRFRIVKPTAAEIEKRDGENYRYPTNVDWVAKAEQEWRRRWRATVLLIKVKLEFVDDGTTTLDREFLPYAVLTGGQTVSELIESGGLPLLSAGR